MSSNPTLFLYTGNGTLAAQDRSGSLTLTGSGAVRYQPASGARTNLVTNPRFANNTNGWASGSCTINRVEDGSFTPGGYALELTSSTAGGGAYISGNVGPIAQVGQTYTVSFDAVHVSGDTTWSLRFYSLTAAGILISTSGVISTLIATSSVQRFSYEVTVSSAGTHRISPLFARPTATESTIRISNVVIESGSVTSPTYFDGSTGGVWLDPITGILGTAHASPSVSQASLYAEEGTTNVIPDPSFENATITNYWTAQGTAAISKVTTHAYAGSNGGKVVCGAATTDGIHQLATSGAAASNGQSWTLSGRIRAFASGDVGDVVKPAIIERTSADAVVATNLGTSITLTDAWQEFSFTQVLAGGGTVAKVTMGMMNGAAVACDWVVDSLQLENKAYPTSPAIGDIGTGYAFSGTAHASSSTRTATVVSASVGSRVRYEQGAYAARGLYDYVAAAGTQYFIVAGDWGTAGQDGIGLAPYANTIAAVNGLYRAGAGAVTYVGDDATTADTWVLGYTDWTMTTARAAKDSEALVSTARPTPAGSMTGTLYIGSRVSSFHINGGIGPVAIFSRPLTARERAILNASPLWYMQTLAREKTDPFSVPGTYRRR